jgi:hypothetical protein
MSTPPHDTGNIGFEPPTGIGNSAWIVRVEFGQTPFPQKARHILLSSILQARDAYAYFLCHKQLGP